jgi:hypothetical protein
MVAVPAQQGIVEIENGEAHVFGTGFRRAAKDKRSRGAGERYNGGLPADRDREKISPFRGRIAARAGRQP